MIKSILRCKLSADDFRRAGLRRVTNSLFGGRGDTGPPVLGDPTSWREPNGLDLDLGLHQGGCWLVNLLHLGGLRLHLLLEILDFHVLHQGGSWLKSQGLASALGYLSSSRTGDLGVSSLCTRLGLCFIWANSFLISFLRRSSTYLVQDLVKAFFLD